jgi:hypothetical protein
VPETFLVDGQGIIRYKYIGPITPKALDETIAADDRGTCSRKGE